jgi:AP-1 complex subunit beta-1
MGCLRVEKITEYLCEPLKDTLSDEDPYVRKTAAICVAKLYDSAPTLVEEYELIDGLNALLVDGNAMVVANAVISLKEISKMRGQSVIVLDNTTISKLVAAMNECTEWG